MEIKPNFLIVGAAKCGTTSIFEYIRSHPEVYMPSCKEVSYYAGRRDGYSFSFEEYLSYFSKAKSQKRIGEASGAYLYSESAPLKIIDTLGKEIKIIMILRNPPDMAYSLWAHNKREGYENLSFKKAIRQENDRMNDYTFREHLQTWLYQYAYVDRATYAPQVKRYFDVFGKKNVKVYIYEEFFADTDNSLLDLYDFLEITHHRRKPFTKKYNVAGEIRSRKVQQFYANEHFFTEPIRKVVPAPIRRGMINWLSKINLRRTTRQPMNEEIKEQLQNQFQKSILELEVLLNRELVTLWK
ncbi:MAG: sulfotransferase domain-containing protein [Desulforhopalus sp.]